MRFQSYFALPVVVTLLTGCGSDSPLATSTEQLKSEGSSSTAAATIATWTEQLKSEDSKTRDAAIVEITKAGPAARDAITPLLTSLPENIGLVEMVSRSDALVAIVKADDEKAIEAITQAALVFTSNNVRRDAPPNTVQMIAILTLPKFEANAVPPLLRVLDDKKSSQRSRDFAIRLLSKIGPPAKAAIPSVESYLKDDELKDVATKALQSIRGD